MSNMKTMISNNVNFQLQIFELISNNVKFDLWKRAMHFKICSVKYQR